MNVNFIVGTVVMAVLMITGFAGLVLSCKEQDKELAELKAMCDK